MGVIVECKYCGRKLMEMPLNFEGKAMDFVRAMAKITDEGSANCICQKGKSPAKTFME